MAKLDETELGAIVSAQIQLAKSHDGAKDGPRESRSMALDYYMGKMDAYVPPEVNRSKVVSRDVADTIGWMLPGIMRVYTASDRMAEAEPDNDDDIPFAKEATDGMNHIFWKDNPGYETVYNATWDSLLMGNGIVKTWYDTTPCYKTSFHTGLTEDQRALLLMPEDGDGKEEAPEVIAESAHQVKVTDPETGEPLEITVYDLKIKRKVAEGKFVVEAIPVEQFLIHGDATRTEDAAFTDHWSRKTRSDLVQMGYPKEKVRTIPESSRSDTPEEQSRRLNSESTDAVDKSMELVDYHECFINIDRDGDGEAELLRVCCGGPAGEVMLDWEEWEDENPFDDIPCEPIPHRWTARSIFDETRDVQDVKTALSRQLLNNTYLTNSPQRHVKGKISNTEEIFSPTFGGAIFGDTNSEIIPLVVPYVGDQILQALSHQDEVVARRTGVSRHSMALDPETLQNQTATAARDAKDAGYSQVELVARNMAEWGWSKVFRKLMRLMIKHQGPRRLMINRKPVDIDPRFWNADMKVTINVGLGTGSRDRDLVMLGQVLQTQLGLVDRFMAAGASEDAIDMLPKLIKTMTKMAESAGIKNPEDYYPDYTNEKVEQLKKMAAERAAQPDPKVEADMQMKQAELGLEEKRITMEAQAAAVREQAQMQADMMTKDKDRENDLILEDKKQQFEFAKLHEEGRQKDLDRQQQWQLELMKMRAQQEQAERDRAFNAEQSDKQAKGSREIELAKIGAKEKGGKIVGKEDRPKKSTAKKGADGTWTIETVAG